MIDDSGGVRSGLAKLSAGLSVGRSVAARKRRLVGFIVPFAFGAALTVGVYFTLADRRRSDNIARFEEIVSEMAAALQANLDLQFETLHGIPPFFAASDEVSRSDFSVFVRPAMRRYSSIYVFQWLPRVTAADRVAFEALLRAEGYPGSGLREILDAENARPAADRPEALSDADSLESQAERLEGRRRDEARWWGRGVIYSALGDRERAMELLQQFEPQWWYDYSWEPGVVIYEPLRDHPEFQELMRPKG